MKFNPSLVPNLYTRQEGLRAIPNKVSIIIPDYFSYKVDSPTNINYVAYLTYTLNNLFKLCEKIVCVGVKEIDVIVSSSTDTKLQIETGVFKLCLLNDTYFVKRLEHIKNELNKLRTNIKFKMKTTDDFILEETTPVVILHDTDLVKELVQKIYNALTKDSNPRLRITEEDPIIVNALDHIFNGLNDKFIKLGTAVNRRVIAYDMYLNNLVISDKLFLRLKQDIFRSSKVLIKDDLVYSNYSCYPTSSAKPMKNKVKNILNVTVKDMIIELLCSEVVNKDCIYSAKMLLDGMALKNLKELGKKFNQDKEKLLNIEYFISKLRAIKIGEEK